MSVAWSMNELLAKYGKDERITQGELSEIQGMTFDPLNVMILKRKPGRPDTQRKARQLMRFGNPDDVFAQSRPKTGLITQAEVRAIALAQLDLQPSDVMTTGTRCLMHIARSASTRGLVLCTIRLTP